MSVKPKQFEVLDDEERYISGWASVEILDRQGDIVPVSEMKRAMLKFMDRGGNLMYQHSNKPIGKVLQWEVEKYPDTDVYGIHFIGKIFKDYPIDDIVWQGLKKGEFKGFSIGATAKGEKRLIKDATTGLPKEVSILRDLSLSEISPVKEPANQLALVDEVNYVAKELRNEKEDEATIKRRTESIEAMTKILKGAKTLLEFVSNVRDYANSIKKEQNRERIIEEFEKTREDLLSSIVEVMKPFGKWEDFGACVSDMKSKGYDEETAKKICGKLQAEHEKQNFGEPRTDEERARRHHGISDDEWNKLPVSKREELISKLPPRGAGFGMEKQEGDDVSCPSCGSNNWRIIQEEDGFTLSCRNCGEDFFAEMIFEEEEVDEEEIPEEEYASSLKSAKVDVDTSKEKPKRPPKKWWDRCVRRVSQSNPDYDDEQVSATCGSMWYHRWGMGTKHREGR